jgi:REP element-mobilizing transposase RayT
MSTFTQILYHTVFSTKDREPTLAEAQQKRLYSYIWKTIENHGCHLYRIGGVEDHIHFLHSLHPSTALADLVKGIKLSSSQFIKQEKLFPHFTGWQAGYGAFTEPFSTKDRLIEYIKGQKEHHRQISFRDEYRSLLNEHQITFEEKYLL